MTEAPSPLARMLPADLYAAVRRSRLSLREAVAAGRLGTHRARHRGPGIDFFDHRGYVPGDDLRFVDFRAAARRDRVVVRRTETELDLDLWILLDASGGMAYPGGPGPTKFDAARALACALAVLAVRGGDRVAALVGSNGDLHPLLARPRGGMAAVHDMARRLSRLHPSGTCPWHRVRSRLAPGGRRHRVLVLLSDLLDPGAGAPDPEAAERAIRQTLEFLRVRGDAVAVCRILHGDERTFPFDAVLLHRFEDLRGVHPAVEAGPADLRRGYLAAMERYDRDLVEHARRHGYVLVEVPVPGTYIDPFHRLLAALAGAAGSAQGAAGAR